MVSRRMRELRKGSESVEWSWSREAGSRAESGLDRAGGGERPRGTLVKIRRERGNQPSL